MPDGATDLGNSFEQFIINEVRAYLSYSRKLSSMTYWRSRKNEVDLIIGNQLAIEIKFSKSFKTEFVSGLQALREENKVKEFIVVGRFEDPGKYDGITYLNYQTFLKRLWNDEFKIR